MPPPAHAPAHGPRTDMHAPTSHATAPLPLTWMARAWWQRLACIALPCALMWGLVGWAVALP
ncbi:hypothetical protein ACOZ4Y_08185 [Komagataeibacter rhaeticus]|nr:hypothetical protein [Komagataeibacter rhaeticus]KDU96692.1 hypothetical protein GLUCORHAEAF1_00370 [Komagataeibacter rhaeticus AF1]